MLQADPQPCEARWDLPAGISAVLKGTKVQVENSQLFPQSTLLSCARADLGPCLLSRPVALCHLILLIHFKFSTTAHNFC